MTGQRRSSPRKRTLLQGRIVFNDRFSLIDCVVRDLSTTGAKIAFAHPIDIPPEFDLEIPKKGLSFRTRVVWSNGKEHGLFFLDGPTVTDGNGPAGLDAARRRDEEASRVRIKSILDEARHRIAREMGIPAGSIGLRIEDMPQGGSNER